MSENKVVFSVSDRWAKRRKISVDVSCVQGGRQVGSADSVLFSEFDLGWAKVAMLCGDDGCFSLGSDFNFT